MKKIYLLLFAFMSTISLFSQSETIPKEITITNVNSGQKIKCDAIDNSGKPFVIITAATYSKPSMSLVSEIKDVYKKWQKDYGVKVVVVMLDDAKTFSKIKPIIVSKGWDFDVYADLNRDFQNKMNSGQTSAVFIINGKKEIVEKMDGITVDLLEAAIQNEVKK